MILPQKEKLSKYHQIYVSFLIQNFRVHFRMTYVIGDIHGMLDECLLLLDEIHRHHANTSGTITIFAVGDLVDRGPQTAKTIEFLADKSNGIRSVQGNHDTWFCACMKEMSSSKPPKLIYDWLRQGGMETLASYVPEHLIKKIISDDSPALFDLIASHIPEHHISFLKQLPLMLENDVCIVTHALCTPRYYALLKQYDQKKIPEYIQLFVQWNRDAPDAPISREKIHISGHTPVQNALLFEKTNAINIDTGAVFGGKLSAVCVETLEVLSVDAKSHQFVQIRLTIR